MWERCEQEKGTCSHLSITLGSIQCCCISLRAIQGLRVHLLAAPGDIPHNSHNANSRISIKMSRDATTQSPLALCTAMCSHKQLLCLCLCRTELIWFVYLFKWISWHRPPLNFAYASFQLQPQFTGYTARGSRLQARREMRRRLMNVRCIASCMSSCFTHCPRVIGQKTSRHNESHFSYG